MSANRSPVTKLGLSGALALVTLPVFQELRAAPTEGNGSVPRIPGLSVAGLGEGLLLAPLKGWTTVWHQAPESTAVPAGVPLIFALRAPAAAEVRWQGAQEFLRTIDASFAMASVMAVGSLVVRAERIPLDTGSAVASDSRSLEACTLHGVDVDALDVRVTAVEVSGLPPSYGMPPLRSIAEVRQLSDDMVVTSVDRMVRIRVATQPPGFEPLVELRTERAVGLGSLEVAFDLPGPHVVSIGPPGLQRLLEVLTYRAFVVNAEEWYFPEDRRSGSFEALTVPTGWEDFVTWAVLDEEGLPRETGTGASFATSAGAMRGPASAAAVGAPMRLHADQFQLALCSCSYTVSRVTPACAPWKNGAMYFDGTDCTASNGTCTKSCDAAKATVPCRGGGTTEISLRDGKCGGLN